MVKSLYVTAYLNDLKKRYAEQGVEFSNYNDKDLKRRDDGKAPGNDVFYVPKNDARHMVDPFVRYALSRQTVMPGEPFVYLGWNCEPARALDGTRSHHMERRVPVGDEPLVRKPKNVPDGSKQIKWYRMCTWKLAVFMLTNDGTKAEDLEELYEARMQMESEIPVDAGSEFILDWPDFKINTQHEVLQTSNPLLSDDSNLWGLKFDVTLTGPAIEFSEKQLAPARAVSVRLYETGRYGAANKEHAVITVEKL